MSFVMDKMDYLPEKKKRKMLRFSTHEDCILLKKIKLANPFLYPTRWQFISETVASATGKGFTKRAVKERFTHLMHLYRIQDTDNLRKSGPEEDYQEKLKLLQELIKMSHNFSEVSKKQKTSLKTNNTEGIGIEEETSSLNNIPDNDDDPTEVIMIPMVDPLGEDESVQTLKEENYNLGEDESVQTLKEEKYNLAEDIQDATPSPTLGSPVPGPSHVLEAEQKKRKLECKRLELEERWLALEEKKEENAERRLALEERKEENAERRLALEEKKEENAERRMQAFLAIASSLVEKLNRS